MGESRSVEQPEAETLELPKAESLAEAQEWLVDCWSRTDQAVNLPGLPIAERPNEYRNRIESRIGFPVRSSSHNWDT